MTAPVKQRIDSIYDFSDKGLIELKSWLEPWFLNRAVAAAAGLEYVSSTWQVDTVGGLGGDANRYGMVGGEVGIRYELGGSWFTSSTNSYQLDVGTYLIFMSCQFGDPYQLGGLPLISLMDGVATFATGGASVPVASPWFLGLSNMASAGSITPFTYSVTAPGGVTYMSITVIRLSTRAGGAA